MTAAQMSPPRVSVLALLRVFWRSLFLQAAWNPRGMQNLGFAFAMQPALRELYPDSAARARAAERHLEFFNCHPYLAAAIVGGAVRLEEDVARGAADPRSVSAFKAALGPPFAALGDGFFWLALRPAAALIAAVTEPYLGLYCVLVFLAIYDGVHLAARAWLFFAGYQRGEGIVSAVSHAHVPQSTGYLKWIAALFAGALAARTVLTAGLPNRPWHAVFIAALIVAMAAALPRLQITVALYVALALGLALGGGLL
ncbi:MAG TPA: PTS system mannose/fructose/sorbose family transporter subunit IID [Myxococcales bacterium]|nr:PTS system mannose/fructose/sorbose family transporter subunit IID [Myxococcales bacterium]